jgi:hypothetical protein
MTSITKVYRVIGNLFALIMMLPVVLIGMSCLLMYWSVKLPFWYLSRKMRR